MNVKTKLILAATAVGLLSTPALARDMGDAGGDSALARFHSGGYSFGYTIHPRYSVEHQHRSHYSHFPSVSGLRGGFHGDRRGDVWGHWGNYYGPMVAHP